LIGDLFESRTGALHVASENTSFAIDKNGVFVRDLLSFGFDMSHAPVETSDGAVYAVAGHGIYRVDPEGIVLFHEFTGPDGRAPYGALIEDGDGALYGTTREGGAFGFGTVFRLTPAGALTTLHHFSSADGAHPLGTLVQGEDGLLYGTTLAGGSTAGAGFGTVFRIATDGTSFATLHAFGGPDGSYPVAGLTRGSSGTFFGTAIAGGQGTGVVFAVTSAGAFAVVHAFAPGQGATPLGGVTVMPDGSLYGTTLDGGTGAVGVIYRLSAGPGGE
jgi:uncharacterized repeat protein (TIGR03803 family)